MAEKQRMNRISRADKGEKSPTLRGTGLTLVEDHSGTIGVCCEVSVHNVERNTLDGHCSTQGIRLVPNVAWGLRLGREGAMSLRVIRHLPRKNTSSDRQPADLLPMKKRGTHTGQARHLFKGFLKPVPVGYCQYFQKQTAIHSV